MLRQTRLRLTATALAAATMLSAAAPALAGNIIQELRREGRFTSLLAALDATGLTAVRDCRSCTLFAPNNAAFARLPDDLVAGLLTPGGRSTLAAILTYHVVASAIPASAVPTSPTLVQTINASEAKIRALRQHGRVTINGVRVLEADIRANGSIIHEVRNVLFPGVLH